MEPPSGFWASLLSFLKFLPYFCGLLILGFIKGAMLLSLLSVCLSSFLVHFILFSLPLMRSIDAF
jgi:hypothetical protein